jgi:protein-S-isoprenylcysteine O-methyltransferase Ste14
MTDEGDSGLVGKLVTQILLWFAITAALLFVPAGTLHWSSAWAYLALWLITGTWSALVLAKENPDILRERMRPLRQQAQKGWDRPVLAAILIGWVALHVVAGLDFRNGLSFVPLLLSAIGAAAFVFATYIFHIVMLENSYASPLVKVDAERGQRVISTGPYAWVRHPMYGAAIPYFIGVPLLLGSWYALVVGLILIGVLALRALWEEQTLMAELPGYADYAQRVRYRLLPGVW